MAAPRSEEKLPPSSGIDLHEFKRIMTDYNNDIYRGNPLTLLNEIPEEEMWRFFIDRNRYSLGEEMKKKFLQKGIPKDKLGLPIRDFIKEYEPLFADEIKSLRDVLHRYYTSVPESLSVRQLLAEDNGWLGFEKTEPGYLAALMQTWHYITVELLTNKDLKDSPDRLVQLARVLHRNTTKDVANVHRYHNEAFFVKETRTEDPFLKTSTTKYSLGTSNTTRTGFDELLEKIKKSTPWERSGYFFLLSLCESKEIPFEYTFIIGHEKYQDSNFFYDVSNPKFIIASTLTDSQKEDIFNRYIKGAQEVNLYTPIRGNPDEVYHTAMTELAEKYKRAILTAAPTSMAALRVIVEFIRDCEQLHPFQDANTRTYTMSLMNYLLMANSFPPTILANPNHMEGYGLDELVQEVLKGMRKTLELAQDKRLVGEISTADIRLHESPEAQAEFEKCVAIERTRRAFVVGKLHKASPSGKSMRPAAPT